jgi:hypothetical protein
MQVAVQLARLGSSPRQQPQRLALMSQELNIKIKVR